MSGSVTVDGRQIPIEGETNLLSLIRKANIDIPTFCYHSELSTYGACRLCLVEIDGKKIDASCVVPPKDGMSIRTATSAIRRMRKMNLELILANHPQECPTCSRSSDCKLRDLSARLGVDPVRFRRTREKRPIDTGVALVRDPNKCILCGDCVRYCSEIQGVGAIDFAYRGEDVMVTPAFNKSISEVNCVHCGQCAAVCPTAAIVPRSEKEAVWAAIEDPDATVVAQVAPAVRVALGEMFAADDSPEQTGRTVAALKRLGFDSVYDTCFAADLTVLEEAHELEARLDAGSPGPMFTSCCPAWVTYAEQNHAELLDRLSSCMSPQSMMGSLIKQTDAVRRPDRKVVVVSIMPCTAKKSEAKRAELSADGEPLVDHVITTTELGQMIQEAGIRFANLEPEAMDLPFGAPSGAGVIFGTTGGVSEAVVRHLSGPAAERSETHGVEFTPRNGNRGILEATVTDRTGRALRLAVVQGLANAREIAREATAGESAYDLVEVMACPGGCLGGAGQPIGVRSRVAERRKALKRSEAERPLRRSAENPFVQGVYARYLDGNAGSVRAHDLLHTRYQSKQRIEHTSVSLSSGTEEQTVPVKVCVGTSCFLRGSQVILEKLLEEMKENGSGDRVELSATFCSEQCSAGPTVQVADTRIHHATVPDIVRAIQSELKKRSAPDPALQSG